MNTECPCCRQRVETKLPIVDLNTNTLSFGDTHVHLSPQKAEILTVLLERFPAAVSHDTLIRRVWGITEPEKPLIILKTLKCALCRVLRKIGYDIVNTPHVGYKLEKLA